MPGNIFAKGISRGERKRADGWTSCNDFRKFWCAKQREREKNLKVLYKSLY